MSPEEQAVAVATNLIKASFEAVMKSASSFAKDAWQKIFEDFEPFMRKTYERNLNVRILSQKDKDVNLYDIYVNPQFSCGDDVVSDQELILRIVDRENILINGTGGAGKTFFMRHAWLSLFEAENDLVPIFIELRNLNDLTDLDLETFIRNSISSRKELTIEVFRHFCELGRFCIILDGFDEVVHDKRDLLQEQILNFATEYRDCSVVVSSRLEKRFAGWSSFNTFSPNPFNFEQVQELIEKVPFESATKKRFLKKLTPDFFSSNQTFLSNPLLAIMMLMTFRQNMEIPKKMNIFYDQAFTTLYLWHDATKAFTRKKLLDIEAFQRSFGAFCLLSYYKEFYEFTKTDIHEFISQSNRICGYVHDPELVLNDYDECVNLLKLDGLKFVFIHRSFQEYFAAYALMRIVPDKFGFFAKAIEARHYDNVLKMCYEMDRKKVVESYVKPRLEEFKQAGLVGRRGNSEYYFLEKLGIKYFISIVTDDEVEEKNASPGLWGEYLNDIGPKFGNFFNFQLKVDSSDLEGKSILSDAMPSHLFPMFSVRIVDTLLIDHTYDKVVESIPTNVGLKAEVTFLSGRICVEVVCDSDEYVLVQGELKEYFQERIDNNLEAFADQDALLSKLAKHMVEWSKKEIKENEACARSLEDILSM